MRLTLATLCLLAPLVALAQAPAPDTPAPLEVAAALPAAPPTLPESCRAVSDKAMASDLKALTAQAQKMEAADLLQLHAASEGIWTLAVERCEGRAKERAQRNLAESQKASALLKEQLGDGPECTAAHKDAATLQDLARAALGERRWGDAATLFHKSEDMWDQATERCTGTQKEVAIKRQEQSETDGFNAEFCAPLFDRAREQTQKFRASSAGMAREDKQDGLMVAETLWRDALAQCKGAAAQDSARNNAQALARERGTPWVARIPVAAKTASSTAPKVGATTASTGTTTAALGNALSGALAAVTAAVQPSAPAAPGKPPPQAQEFTVGDMRFQGQFVPDVDTPTYSGSGKLTWANGDLYEGQLKSGKRHGKGLFVWANGQRYRGDWVNDIPSGTAVVDFANGNHYEGPVENAIPTGNGSMAYGSGDRYSGRFLAGEPNGTGSYTWKNGQKFDGEWKDGKPNGQGTLLFSNGDRYEGTVADGMPSQSGTFHWTNGDRYAGQWKAGTKDGQGIFTWSTGDRWEGIYERDVQTSSGTLIRKTP